MSPENKRRKRACAWCDTRQMDCVDRPQVLGEAYSWYLGDVLEREEKTHATACLGRGDGNIGISQHDRSRRDMVARVPHDREEEG